MNPQSDSCEMISPARPSMPASSRPTTRMSPHAMSIAVTALTTGVPKSPCFRSGGAAVPDTMSTAEAASMSTARGRRAREAGFPVLQGAAGDDEDDAREPDTGVERHPVDDVAREVSRDEQRRRDHPLPPQQEPLDRSRRDDRDEERGHEPEGVERARQVRPAGEESQRIVEADEDGGDDREPREVRKQQ